MQKLEKAVSLGYRYVSLAVLATLAVAGLLHLVAGLDALIAYPLVVLLIGFLIRELLV